MIEKLPNDLNVAVIVYGVSKQRGCEDIDLVQQLGPISDKAAPKSKLLGHANTGMTPIAPSWSLRVSHIKSKGGSAIVLVTDGAESSSKAILRRVASKLASEFE